MKSARPSAKRPQTAGRKGTGSARRDQIATVASGLFARNGFAGTSIRDIAAAAGLTKPALYYHFSDKEALYEHVVAERMTGLISVVTEAVEQTDDPVERIRCYIRAHSTRMDTDRDIWLVTKQSFQSLEDAERRQRITALRDRFEHLLRDLISEAMDQGALERADPVLVARLLLSSVNDIPRWLKPGGDLLAQQVALTYSDIALRGLGAQLPLN
ncbi:TetR family transcriptional regulator [Pseudooceanicola sp. 216_PA32_1]|jgi:TetR/AcrR family transcriptional regulator, cholesterol catabolism regulator|uniref:TetR family transcriptional regulator n=1 Tax=Pseudooceanicola pacificus TaxID=2676438 RepID=A0A844WBW6_9RHOB|nr:TetR/AcrR family transcriptional regulator [Pseudooceanicola pacificus]MWB76870.1 TetR family transcriptional regulator [Pseudooceanicola pacificus]